MVLPRPRPRLRVPRITIEVTPGELFDRVTIQRLRLRHARDQQQQQQLQQELTYLEQRAQELGSDSVRDLVQQLEEVNATLWKIEDAIRVCEKRADFGTDFRDLARQVYVNNDRRAEIKQQITAIFGSDINDNKIYGSGDITDL